MSEGGIEVIYPPLLREMIDRIMKNPLEAGHHKSLTEYNGGWLLGAAEREYCSLLSREEVPPDPRVVRLLCEIAVLRALIGWHEVRDRPPPMPSIKDL